VSQPIHPDEVDIGDGLRLVPVRADFAPAAFEVIQASQAEFSRWLRWAGEPQLEETLAHFTENERQWSDGSAYHYAVFYGDQLVGSIGLRINAMNPQAASIGYWMGTPWAGRGYTSRAAAALRDIGFDRVGLRRQELGAGVDNIGSRRVAEKMGMRREGLKRAGAQDGEGRTYDLYWYGMLRDDPRRDTGERSVDAEPALTAPDWARAAEGSGGLITAVIQDQGTGDVLMVAYMDEEAYRRTRESGHAWFWSRSRQRLWEKGETSGDYLDVRSVTIDCDGDSVLVLVSPHGPACHTGARTCFHNPTGRLLSGL
jgi:phosphoribosyl-AMP cyclohydrolase